MDPRLSPAARIASAGQVAPSDRARARSVDSAAFKAALDTATLRFSSHAKERLESRGLTLDAGQLKRLESGIDAAARKGSREALLVVDDVAMVVAVPNRTIVTAVSADEAGASVFTNIDAAVIT